MAPTDAVGAPLEALREADLDDALALSAEAGWNQGAADWRLMLRVGTAYAVRDEGRVVATALALPYAPALGWVSMVLVHGPYRRRGLATRLVERATATLTGAGLLPVLDATPAGAEVYARMGYRPVERLQRWRGTAHGLWVEPPVPELAKRVRDLDRTAFGADRGAILADLAARPAPIALADPSGEAYLLSRAGRTATQLGPLVARRGATAATLLQRGLGAVTGTVVVDVPERAGQVAAVLEASGFEPERPFVRMAFERDAIPGDATLVHAIAGPELG